MIEEGERGLTDDEFAVLGSDGVRQQSAAK